MSEAYVSRVQDSMGPATHPVEVRTHDGSRLTRR